MPGTRFQGLSVVVPRRPFLPPRCSGKNRPHIGPPLNAKTTGKARRRPARGSNLRASKAWLAWKGGSSGACIEGYEHVLLGGVLICTNQEQRYAELYCQIC